MYDSHFGYSKNPNKATVLLTGKMFFGKNDVFKDPNTEIFYDGTRTGLYSVTNRI